MRVSVCEKGREGLRKGESERVKESERGKGREKEKGNDGSMTGKT